MMFSLHRFSLCGLGWLFFVMPLSAQFAPPAGVPGSTAIAADDPAFVAWGHEVTIQRGPQQIGIDSLGEANAGTWESAIGKAGESGTISLGDGGSATFYFPMPVYNGPGDDFAVFENGFSDDFLELAFVEVSTDGVQFQRFPSQSLTDTSVQIPTFGLLDTRKIDQLAGKYRALFGTPFDLEILKNTPGLDLQRIHYVRVVDVVGSMVPAFQQRDSKGRIINEPWPTPFPTSGFDLDAIGVLHQRSVNASEKVREPTIQVYPNVLECGNRVHFSLEGNGVLHIIKPDGQRHGQYPMATASTIGIDPSLKGIWYWLWESEGTIISGKFLVL